MGPTLPRQMEPNSMNAPVIVDIENSSSTDIAQRKKSFLRRTMIVGIGTIAAITFVFVLARQNLSAVTESSGGFAWIILPVVLFFPLMGRVFGPVFFHELTRIGRKKRTFSLRRLYVVVLLLLLCATYYFWLNRLKEQTSLEEINTVQPSELAVFANNFFELFVLVQYVTILFLTPVYSAGTITDEKERRTLEFLLATDLADREIIFGKLVARTVLLVMYILAGLPVLAFMQLFGGIDPEQLLNATAATFMTIVGLASFGVWFSVRMSRSRDAIMLTYLTLIGWLIISYLLGHYLGIAQFRDFRMAFPVFSEWIEKNQDIFGPLGDWIGSGNVFYMNEKLDRLRMVARAGNIKLDKELNAFLFRYTCFWGAVTVFFLWRAGSRLRSLAIKHMNPEPPKLHKTALRRDLLRQTKDGKLRDKPPIGRDPIFWKEVYSDSTRRSVLWSRVSLFAIICLAFVAPIAVFIDLWTDDIRTLHRWDRLHGWYNGWVRISTVILGSMAMFTAAIRGATSVTGELEKETWVSLICTPQTAWELARGKWFGAVLGARRLYYALVFIWVVAAAFGSLNILMVPLCVLWLLICASAFAWAGIYCSATARTSLVALTRTFLAASYLMGGFLIFVPITDYVLRPSNRTNDVVHFKEKWVGS